jgi:hypothetical protein
MAIWGGAVMTGVLLVCATAQGGPPYEATEQPPPRGTPPPRLGELPPPPPGRASESAAENERRFPVNEGQKRKEDAQRARAPASGHVEVHSAGGGPSQACNGLVPEERIECPLRDARDVLAMTDIPRGVRVRLRSTVYAPDKLQRLFDCHQSLARMRPQSPGPCGFLDARTTARVTGAPGRLELDVTRGEDVHALRQQVRAVLGSKR